MSATPSAVGSRPTDNNTPPPGQLILVPTPLDFGIDLGTAAAQALGEALPQATIARAATISHWVVENAKSARAFLKRVADTHPLGVPLQAQTIIEVPREAHKNPAYRWDAKPMLAAALEGHDVGLLSEAGLPAVADPGSEVVRAAHDLGIAVVPLPGASALLLALAASGMNGQGFCFMGYLPTQTDERPKHLRQLEADSAKTGETKLFIEVPHRNAALWQAMLTHLKPSTRVMVASGVATPAVAVHSNRVAAFKQAQSSQPLAFNAQWQALPCVFGLLA